MFAQPWNTWLTNRGKLFYLRILLIAKWKVPMDWIFRKKQFVRTFATKATTEFWLNVETSTDRFHKPTIYEFASDDTSRARINIQFWNISTSVHRSHYVSRTTPTFVSTFALSHRCNHKKSDDIIKKDIAKASKISNRRRLATRSRQSSCCSSSTWRTICNSTIYGT